MKLLTPDQLPNFYFLALPFAVAGLSLGAGVTALLVLAGLLWKWGAGFAKLAPREGPPPLLRLETIGASHIVEKVRWHLDRLGAPYEEQRAGGILGILFSARSVPRLHIDAGPSSSCIGDSTEILRFLWGRYGVSHRKEAAFLQPTAESLELERRMNLYAEDVRRYVYLQVLPHRSEMLRMWGAEDPALPRWQRMLMRVAFPLLKGFTIRGLRVDPEKARESAVRARAFLSEMEARLQDGGPVLRRGPLHSIDLQFAASSALWVQPTEFGGPWFAAHYQISLDDWPEEVRRELETWEGEFPHTAAYVRKLYAEERAPRPQLSE
jgi:hypothetical protein